MPLSHLASMFINFLPNFQMFIQDRSISISEWIGGIIKVIKITLLICSCSGQVLLAEDLHTMLEGVGVVGTGAMTSILISTLQAVGIKVGIDPNEVTHAFFKSIQWFSVQIFVEI